MFQETVTFCQLSLQVLWELLSFFFFLKMTYEDFSSLCETTVYHVYLSMNKPSLQAGASCLVLAFILFVMASQHQSYHQLIDLICLSHHLFHQVLSLQQMSAANAQLKIWDLLSTCAPPVLFWHHTSSSLYYEGSWWYKTVSYQCCFFWVIKAENK